jgi:predicted DNA-binding transcriptional regulator YafY
MSPSVCFSAPIDPISWGFVYGSIMATNTQMIRLRTIADLLKTYRYRKPLTRQRVVEILRDDYSLGEVALKTVSRDMETLQSDFDAPIDQTSQRGYYLTDPSWVFHIESFTAHEVQTLLLATELTAQYKGSPLHHNLKNLTKTLQARCPEKISEDLTKKVEFLSPPAAHIAPHLWEPLLVGLLDKRRLQIDYTTAAGITTAIEIAPCKLVSIENEWYLFSVKRGETLVRQLAVRNIQNLQLLNSTFKKDYQETIRSMLENRFGWFACDRELSTVTVTFDRAIAFIIGSRRWHATEQKELLDNGDISISFPVSGAGHFPFFEVRQWILGYAPYVKEISPPELKQMIISDLQTSYSYLTAAPKDAPCLSAVR